MKRDEAIALAEQGIEILNESLGQGRSDTLKQYLDVMSRFYHYSSRNCLLISSQRPDATQVAGFGNWKKLGRQVKKGEKGIAILAPLAYKKESETSTFDKRAETEDVESSIRGFKVVHVFDISQTEGESLPVLREVTGNHGEWLERIEQTIQDAEIELEYADNLDGAKGVSQNGKISILSNLEEGERFAVLVHEYAHEILHKGERRSETTTTIRETEAEAVSYVVSRAIGLSEGEWASNYIQLCGGDSETLQRSMSEVQKTSASILEQLHSLAA